MKFLTQNRKILAELLVVLVFFVFSRLPNLGHDNFNTDVWKWKSRTYDFSSGVFYLQPEKTLQKYHPGVPLMWTGTFAIKLFNGYYELVLGKTPPDNDIAAIFQMDFVQKLLVVFVMGISIMFIYYPLRRLFGLLYAAIFVLLLSLEPFYLALTRVYHLEGLMTTFMLAGFTWLVYGLNRDKEKRFLFVSALFSSLAILTKSSALSLLPLVGLVLFFDKYSSTKDIKKSILDSFRTFSWWLCAVVCMYIIFWPAMWVIPLDALNAIYRGIFTIGVERGHEQIFFGRMLEDPGLAFYPVVFILKSSPILLLGIVLGYFVLRKHPLTGAKKNLVLFALAFALINLIEISLSSKKLDRYMLPTIVFILFSCAAVFEQMLLHLRKHLITKFLAGSVLIWVFYLGYFINTDYFSYFNPVFGGLKVGQRILESKWLFGQQEISDYFVQMIKSGRYTPFTNEEEISTITEEHLNLVIAFPEKYYTQLWPFIREIGAWAVIEDLTPEAKLANYFVYPVWDDYSSLETRFKLKYFDSIKIRGVPSYNVYAVSR